MSAMAKVDQGLLDQAEQRLRGGDWQAALAITGGMVKRYPDASRLQHLHGLGMVFKGDLAAALACLDRARRLAPDNPTYRADRARVLRRLGRHDEAIAAYRALLAGDPESQELLNELGALLFERQRFEECREIFERAALLDSRNHRTFTRLGLLCFNMGDFEAAEQAYRRAIALAPGDGLACYNLATVLRLGNRFDDGLELLEKTARRFPREAVHHCTLAHFLNMEGLWERAEVAARTALALDPANDTALEILSSVLLNQQRVEETLTLLADHRRTATQHDAYGRALAKAGDIDGALEQFERAAGLRSPTASSNYLFCLNYLDRMSREALHTEHLRHARLITEHATLRGHLQVASYRHDRLRIGYVSPDFRQHSVGYFILPLLEHHDRARFEIYAYSDYALKDRMNRAIAGTVERWREIVGLTNEAVIEQLRRDEIDILVDLCGHTANNRMALFAARAAPVQLAYLGYPNTTGLATMDYRFTDAIADPDEADQQCYVERLLRIDGGFLCYSPPADAPAPGAGRAAAATQVTFASFNNPYKISASCIRIWLALLGESAAYRLLLKAHQFRDPWVVDKFRQRFVKAGANLGQLVFSPAEPETADHLRRYHEVDIALDTFPYHGTTTTMEALWMGVPVITLHGDRHAARVSSSILQRIGCPELVVSSEEEYVTRAVELAADGARLDRYRSGLRSRLAASSLMDAPRLAREIERHYAAIAVT